MYRTLVASSRRVSSCCPRVAPTAVHNRLTSPLSLKQQQLQQLSRHTQSTLSRRLYSSDNKKPPRGTGNEDEEGREEPWIPEYEDKFHEASEEKRQRLLYQSRKRGILENGLLLGSFADKYLDSMSEEEMALYDRLINLPSNDWEIYYWATGAKPTPDEFDNELMDKLKEHAKNKDKESRIVMPPLKS